MSIRNRLELQVANTRISTGDAQKSPQSLDLLNYGLNGSKLEGQLPFSHHKWLTSYNHATLRLD